MHIIIAAGGTGGHVFPALSVAKKIKELDPTSTITFVGTRGRFEEQAVPKAGFDIQYLPAVKLKGMSRFQTIKSLLQLPLIIIKAMALIRKEKVDAVLGFGGYISGPTVLAGWILGKKTAICEQNTIPGLANRWLGKFVKYVFTSFDYSKRYFPKEKILLAGNPVREGFQTEAQVHCHPAPSTNFHILVIGGSLGAKAINDVMPLTLDLLKKKGCEVSFTHQTGALTFESTERLYQAVIPHARKEITPFIDDMPGSYAKADLIISRAGATSVAEIMATQKPSILIPLPSAIDNHQHVNAEALEEKHACILLPQLELTPLRLSNEISALINNPERTLSMRKQLGYLKPKEDPSRTIANKILNKF